jgi:hypothetical protein
MKNDDERWYWRLLTRFLLDAISWGKLQQTRLR